VGTGSSSLAGAPAISRTAYQALAPKTATLSQIVARFGAPVSKSVLHSLLGANVLASLIHSQPSGDLCAYYLDRGARTANVYQLCFDSAYTLAEQSIVSTSGGTNAS
jgi:hypothetical protein